MDHLLRIGGHAGHGVLAFRVFKVGIGDFGEFVYDSGREGFRQLPVQMALQFAEGKLIQLCRDERGDIQHSPEKDRMTVCGRGNIRRHLIHQFFQKQDLHDRKHRAGQREYRVYARNDRRVMKNGS